jgi:hypothetical protein
MTMAANNNSVRRSNLVLSMITVFLLVLSVYSVTSMHYVSAVKTSRQCGESRDLGGGYVAKDCCDITEDDDGKISSVKCFTIVCNDKSCEASTKSAPKINPEDLSQLVENNTKSPNTDILKGNDVLQGNNNDNTENNTSNDNVKEPKAPKVPEDLGGLHDDGG